MDEPIIRPHGGYRGLKAFEMAEIVYDGTVRFCERVFPARSRTAEQMIQAGRSGKQNIAEGSQASGTSSKTELRLIDVARASQEELLLDCQDYLRINKLLLWPKDGEKSEFIGKFGAMEGRTYETYRPYVEEKTIETAANAMVCLVHQTSFLLDRLLQHLETKFKEDGGFTERLYKARIGARNRDGGFDR